MAAPYQIIANHETGSVEAILRGFWTVDDVDKFGRDLSKAFDAIAAGGKEPVVLSNSMESAVHSPAVVEAMQHLAAQLAPRPRKTAVLTTGHLYRMQAKRIIPAFTIHAAFADRDEAIAWLLAAD